MYARNNSVGVIGSGPVGKALAKAFVATGYAVMIGSRSPEKLNDFVSANNDTISAGSFVQTAQFGDIVVMATHGEATENAIDLSDPRNFGGKTVIDASNPLDISEGTLPTILRTYAEVSLGECVLGGIENAKWLEALVPHGLEQLVQQDNGTQC